MAQIYSRIPVSNMQRGERLVYDHMALLPADWVIFHSCKEDYLEEQHYIHFEADFVAWPAQAGPDARSRPPPSRPVPLCTD